jgi:ADP-heptose:LPS heptosyltransferase
MLEQRIYPGLRPILGIFPGASWRPKAWMPDRFAEIARRAIGEWNAQIALVGGSRESDLIERIVAQVDAPIGVFRELPLGVLGGVLRHCDRFLSSDSGPMHLAVGVGTPTVALFGPSQFGRFAPEHAPHVGVRVPMPCSPCKERGDHCRNNACMRLITIDHVWTTLERLEPSNARTTKPM